MKFDDETTEFYEERAAILQYVAGWPREKAEALAMAEAEGFQAAKDEKAAQK